MHCGKRWVYYGGRPAEVFIIAYTPDCCMWGSRQMFWEVIYRAIWQRGSLSLLVAYFYRTAPLALFLAQWPNSRRCLRQKPGDQCVLPLFPAINNLGWGEMAEPGQFQLTAGLPLLKTSTSSPEERIANIGKISSERVVGTFVGHPFNPKFNNSQHTVFSRDVEIIVLNS